jgi:prepilin-type N-terminal cleavage/methylation domain-containing protein
MQRRSHRDGFTLIELLVVIGVVALLAALSFPVYTSALQHANFSRCASNMHGLSIALMSYAYDNQGYLPGRVDTGDRWPVLLLPYTGNEPSIYVDPGDPVASHIPANQLVSDSVNNSSFIFNGFNDMGAHSNPSYQVNLFSVPASGNLILLGQQKPGGDNFYMDVNDGDQTNVLETNAYFGGANYVFADGSMRFVKLADYNVKMWLVNPNYAIP